MAKRKIRFDNREVTAEEVPFESEHEGWNTYLLQDGTTLKIKTVLAEVMRVEGEYAPSGDPVYMVNAMPMVSTTSPEQLRKKE